MRSRLLKTGYLSYPVYLLMWAAPCALLLYNFFSVDTFAHVFKSRNVPNLVLFTAWQAFLSAAAAFIIAVLPAYYYSRSRSAISVLLGGTLFIPFFFPSISCVIAFSLLFSPGGILSLTGIDPGILYSLKGIIIAHAFYNSPIFVKYLGEALRSVPRDLIEDARVNGGSPLSIFLRVELPLVLPAALRAFFLVFTFSFTSFAVVLAIGGVAYSTIEVEIASVMRSTLDFSYALTLAIIQFAVISIVSFVSGLKKPYTISGVAHNEKRTYIAGFAALIYILFEYSVVAIAVIVSFYNFHMGAFDFSGFEKITDPEFSERFHLFTSIFNTLVISVTGALAAVMLAFIMVKNRFKYSHIAVMSAAGISSAFLAVALSYSQIITGFPGAFFLCVGFICMSIPVAYSFLYHHLSSFDKSYIEEAELLGAGRLQIFRYVEFPMMTPVLLSSALQVFAILFGEFTIAYTMQLQDSFHILSVAAYSVDSARMARESAAISSIALMTVLAVYLTSHFIMDFSRKRDEFVAK